MGRKMHLAAHLVSTPQSQKPTRGKQQPQLRRSAFLAPRRIPPAVADRMSPIDIDIRIRPRSGHGRCGERCRLGVIPARTQVEHIGSASPPKNGHLADIPGQPLGARSSHTINLLARRSVFVFRVLLGLVPRCVRQSLIPHDYSHASESP